MLLAVTTLLLGLTACFGGGKDKPTQPDAKQITVPYILPENLQNTPFVLPEVPVGTANWEAIFRRANYDGFAFNEILAGRYYGRKTVISELQGNVDTDLLIDAVTKKEIPLAYPANFPRWTVGSGAYVVLQGQYFYEWKSYTAQFSGDTLHDVKLTRLDGETGRVEIMDEANQNLPFVYMCKLNKERFLSYSVTQAPSDRVEYATLTVASIYHMDGTKKEIIRERYECGSDWTDSEGTLIERFAVNEGEIYGFGRRRISGEYKFFLYRYDENGKLLDTQAVPGFEDIIGEEQPLELTLIGDFIIFRTHESLSNYICKRTETTTELIMKGAYGSVQYAVSSNHIFFIERNYDQDNIKKEKACPLYAIDTTSGKIAALDFPVPLADPYLMELQALSNGDLLATYGGEGVYDYLKQIQYVLPGDTLKAMFAVAG